MELNLGPNLLETSNHVADCAAMKRGAWSPPEEGSVSLITTARLDISCILETESTPPPVLFENYEGLEDWARSRRLDEPKAIGRIRKSSALLVAGQYHPPTSDFSFRYSQIWARARYTRYASALKKHALWSRKVEADAYRELHADHIINRARLANIKDAWVAIFPVYRSSNCSFGRIERCLPKIEPGFKALAVPPLMALKLYIGKLPRTASELDWAMMDIRGQFDQEISAAKHFCDEIESQAQLYLKS